MVTVSRQTGLNNATGDFVVFLNSVDVINKVYVEELLKAQKSMLLQWFHPEDFKC